MGLSICWLSFKDWAKG